MFLLSLPMRGAWIEIALAILLPVKNRGRSPCGERGLKCERMQIAAIAGWSLPMRGAWIEIILAIPLPA